MLTQTAAALNQTATARLADRLTSGSQNPICPMKKAHRLTARLQQKDKDAVMLHRPDGAFSRV